LGNVRGSNPKTGERVIWREDSLGNLRASDGTVCRTNALGQLKCRGESLPPVLLGQWPSKMRELSSFRQPQRDNCALG